MSDPERFPAGLEKAGEFIGAVQGLVREQLVGGAKPKLPEAIEVKIKDAIEKFLDAPTWPKCSA